MEDKVDSDRIVVGVDGSDASIAALRYAARLASSLGAPLEVISVWSYPPFLYPSAPIGWTPEENATETLEASIQQAFGDKPPEGLTRTVVPGPVTTALIDVSTSSAMLVLGSRGHGGFVGLLLGSVSAALAEHAKCPVLIYHDSPGAQQATSH